MTDWYSAAREADGRTDEEIMAEIKYRADTGAGTPLREAIKADLAALAHLTPEDWAERPGADPIARTINAARDIVDARFDAARRATGPAGLDVAALAAAIMRHAESHKAHSRTHVQVQCAGAIAAEYARFADGPGPA